MIDIHSKPDPVLVGLFFATVEDYLFRKHQLEKESEHVSTASEDAPTHPVSVQPSQPVCSNVQDGETSILPHIAWKGSYPGIGL